MMCRYGDSHAVYDSGSPSKRGKRSGRQYKFGNVCERIERIHQDYAPAEMYLTENGSTYDDVVRPDGSIVDDQRRSFLERHLALAREAIRRGILLKGYFEWSLLDNF